MRKKHTTQTETLGLHPRKCHKCGKDFECRYEYAFKLSDKKKHAKWFCSYSCLRSFEKAALMKNRRGSKPSYEAQKILRLMAEGVSMSKIAEDLGIRHQRVADIRDRWQDWEVRKNA